MPRGKRKKVEMPDVTKIIPRKGPKLPEDWLKADELSDEFVRLANDVQESLDELAKRWSLLEKVVVESYKVTPHTDTGLYYSPISPTRLISALKNYARTVGLKLDQRAYIDETKVPTFSNYVKDGKKWLLKMGYQAPIKEKSNV